MATYDELLKVNRDSDEEEIRRNYHALAKRFHPDRYFDTDDEPLKYKLTKIFNVVTEAYKTLINEDSREKYLSGQLTSQDVGSTVSMDTESAEEQFQLGLREYKKKNYWGAADHFQWAVKLHEKNAQYLECLARSYLKQKTRLKDAEETIRKALHIDPFNAEYQAILGLIYLKAGLKLRASNQFKKVLKYDPSNYTALEELKKLPITSEE